MSSFDPALPGITAPSDELTQELAAAALRRGLVARTRHLDEAGRARFVNRLARESSPYLQQHAHNPVNWFPWGDEAFDRARAEGKLVFLSVGYSTCHWCHVMEHESFEDETIAALINKLVIPVKVDREERPDVDGVYMTTVQMMSGHGGWPMTVFLTPEREPLFGGTYFPPNDGVRGGRIGLPSLVNELARRYAEDPAGMTAQARRFADHLRQYLAPRPRAGVPGARVIRAAVAELAESFDPEYGGFAGAPKFPRPAVLALLARYALRATDEQARNMVELTLARMAQGGLRDHVGGGFHRYSVDEWWLVPHFEKMLYDNAQLAVAYLEGAQLCGRDDFLEIARDTLAYIARELGAPSGGFYSATDADSPGEGGEAEEGAFFTWSPDELEAVLGHERAERVSAYYGVTRHGNFEGRTVLNVRRPVAEVAQGLGVSADELSTELALARRQLYEARRSRPPPLRDDKVLTAWNGLAISAFARVGFAVGDEQLLDTGRKSARFVLEHLVEGGRLRRVYKDGVARQEAFLDDYAFFIAGLLDLYEATHEVEWLRAALAQQVVLDEEFWDEEGGGYFFTSDAHESLLTRDKPDYDGAEPSGNSVAAMSLLRMSEMLSRPELRDRAQSLFAAFGEELDRRPLALPAMLASLDFSLDWPLQVAVVAPPRGEGLAEMLAPLRRTYVPSRVLCVAREGDDLTAQSALVPLLVDRFAEGGKATAYVCRGEVCELPTTDPAALAAALGEIEQLGVDEPAQAEGASEPALTQPHARHPRRAPTSPR
jgi:uncharacterized protein YyaL (SSP411 family)